MIRFRKKKFKIYPVYPVYLVNYFVPFLDLKRNNPKPKTISNWTASLGIHFVKFTYYIFHVINYNS